MRRSFESHVDRQGHEEQGVDDLEKVIEQIQASNEALRRQRNTALHRVDDLNERCGKLASENQSLRDHCQLMKMDNEQLHQQRVNDWKLKKASEEKLIKSTARLARDKHSTLKPQDYCSEAKDTTANLHVTGSSLGTDLKEKEGSRQKDRELKSHKSVDSKEHGSSSLSHDHVTSGASHLRMTSETVTPLPETLRRIRREKNMVNSRSMLADTYPPRPRATSRSCQEAVELGQSWTTAPFRTTLQLPRIPHRTSST